MPEVREGIVEATEEGATHFSDRLRKKLEQTKFDNGYDSMHVTVSLGVTVFAPNQLLDLQSLIRAADHGLYQAKTKGRNQIVVESPKNDPKEKPDDKKVYKKEDKKKKIN